VQPEAVRTPAAARPPASAVSLPALVAGAGAGLAVAALGYLGELSHLRFLIAPLGASAALVWALPNAPLAQPRAVIGGNLVSALIGFAIAALAGHAPWSIGLAVGLVLAAMMSTRTLHAPACALPVFFALDPAAGAGQVLLVVVSSVLLVLMGLAHHRLVTKVRWPERWM
jgi:CBS-domain-containing membrane protein